ncbi:hypothetical protein V1515DRAFT_615488 [Lipomyces mesembrius]
MNIRQVKVADLPGMQNAKLLPENYNMPLYLYHALTWPQASFVATDASGRKIIHCQGIDCSNVTSLAVMRTYRRLGIAAKPMAAALRGLGYLHVRKLNRTALHLYRDTLTFAKDLSPLGTFDIEIEEEGDAYLIEVIETENYRRTVVSY